MLSSHFRKVPLFSDDAALMLQMRRQHRLQLQNTASQILSVTTRSSAANDATDKATRYKDQEVLRLKQCDNCRRPVEAAICIGTTIDRYLARLNQRQLRE